MDLQRKLDGLIEWFTPPQFRDDLHAKKRVRMFLMSHLFGPFLGAPIWISLYILDPSPFPHVPILAASIVGFWLFPILLKAAPKYYTLLALVSVFNLTFAILWGAYHYGGASSPFLMWLLVMPLLAFFYLGSNFMTRLVIFAPIAFGLAAFYFAFRMENSFPVNIPIQQMVELGLISTFCAATYVFFMASYYSSVVDSQSELLREIERHQDTAGKLISSKEEAERANGAKSDFLAKMSHELRTPLNAVLGYSEILLEDAELEGRGEQIADLQKISGAGKHLLAMVNDILDISKIEAGKMELNLEVIDFGKLIDEVESTGRPLASKNTNSFILRRGDDLGTIVADSTKLRQAIFNLLSNAAKFTQNGEITLDARRVTLSNGDWVSISVIDTGTGISKEQQALLFNNFSQASAAITAKYGGTGLGLSLSQNLCRLMGGAITLESELGVGSRFTITLPVAVGAVSGDDSLVAAAEADIRDKAKGFAGLTPRPGLASQAKVLIVDDDEVFLELVERILNKEGYSAICTNAPESVLPIARTVQPAAILVDIKMPALNGWDVLRVLTTDPVTANIPVFMLTVFDERPRALESGAAGLITKPFDISRFRAAMADAERNRSRGAVRALAS